MSTTAFFLTIVTSDELPWSFDDYGSDIGWRPPVPASDVALQGGGEDHVYPGGVHEAAAVIQPSQDSAPGQPYRLWRGSQDNVI